MEDDLRPVLKALIEVLSEWKPIGIGFGLKSSKLEEIEGTHHNNLKKCLIDVITNWLRKNYDTVKFGEPSWRKVVEIVADPAAGDNVVLAKAIAEKHPCRCRHIAMAYACMHAGTEVMYHWVATAKFLFRKWAWQIALHA